MPRLADLTPWAARRDRSTSALLAQVLEVAQLALDLGLDVERLLALALPALVAGDDELAHLLEQLGVVGRSRPASRSSTRMRSSSASTSSGSSPRALWRYAFASSIWRISASRTSAMPRRPSRARPAAGRARTAPRMPLADLPERLAAQREGEGGDRDRDEHDDEDHLAVGEREAEHRTNRVERGMRARPQSADPRSDGRGAADAVGFPGG